MTGRNQNPEQLARDNIDAMLEEAGWKVQHSKKIDFNASPGIAVREYQTDAGPADYALFVDRRLVGVIEAKPEDWGHKITTVEEQSAGYAAAKFKWVNNKEPLPFIYESTGLITRFTDGRDPKPRSREVFTFHRPETMAEWISKPKSLRARLHDIPPLNTAGLRDCQITAIRNLEQSFREDRPRALVQMATGSGKTFTAITSVYRLLKHADAKRILFLVDTKNLGEQAEQEFMSYLPNDDNRKFTELYNVQRLKSPFIAGSSQVCISTIQRMYSILKDEPLDESAEEDNPPRALIRAMVECVRPEPGKTIADPACGTGGFFLACYDFLTNPKNYDLDKAQKAQLKHKTFNGNEIVAGTRRLCLMNMFLHNIGEIDGDVMISPNDALVAASPQSYDYVLANPPFGKKSSMSFTNEEGQEETDDLTYNRQDFWATTSNKQPNFVQHIRTLLKTTGRAAVVVPDNVLFEGGAGETIRQNLLKMTDLHTILRLPTGIFYAHGVKANVIFFDSREASKNPWTKEVWYYDYRTNIHHTLKKKPLRFEHLTEFIECYNPNNRHKRKPTWDAGKNPEGRWRKFAYEELTARDKTSLDVFWLKDKSLTDLDNLPEPDELAEEIIENLEAGLNSFRQVLASLNNTSKVA